MNPFSELGLSEDLVNAVSDLGFTAPSPIQEQAIPMLLDGSNDFVGLAQTGTGKTAAFGLPMLELLNFDANYPQALVLCPTRELCLQITNDIVKFSKYKKNVKVVAVYGGSSIVNQLRDIKRGVQIVVATPGRMLDILGRKAIDFSKVKYVVLDEADEMLNMGFQEDIDEILSTTPDTKKTWLFSATMPQEVRRISKRYMTDPAELTIGTRNSSNVNISHEYCIVKGRDKYAALKRIVDYNPEIFGIIFSRTKAEAQEVAELLMKDGYNADALHGDLSQGQRDKVMKAFRETTLQILVATDVAARGIDVNNVTHVIHYSLPDDIENYTHRSGRTARAGKSGVSISIIHSKEVGKIRQIERVINKKFEKVDVPNGFDVCEKQLFALIHKVHNVEVNEEQISPYMDRIMAEFESLTKEDIIKRFASLEFNRFLEYYQNARDLNILDDDRGRGNDRGSRDSGSYSRAAGGNYTRFFINVGSVDDLTRGDLLGMVCNISNIPGKAVGKIDIKGVYSFFEVENDLAHNVIEGMKAGAQIAGRNIRVEVAAERQSEGYRRGGDRNSNGGGYGGNRRGGGGERRYNDSSSRGGKNRRNYDR